MKKTEDEWIVEIDTMTDVVCGRNDIMDEIIRLLFAVIVTELGWIKLVSWLDDYLGIGQTEYESWVDDSVIVKYEKVDHE